jgi:hypothetical protein
VEHFSSHCERVQLWEWASSVKSGRQLIPISFEMSWTYFLLIALSSRGAQTTTAALNLHLSPCSPRYLVISAAPNENPTPNIGEPG